MKILQINCVYKSGSTGKIVDCIGQELRAIGHDVFTCYGNGRPNLDEYSEKVCTTAEHKFNAVWGRIVGIPFGGIYVSNLRIYNRIKTFHPDVVHIHCINGYTVNVYKLLMYCARHHIKTVVTLHAEIFHTGGCAHAYDCDKWKEGCYDCAVYKKNGISWFFERSRTSWGKMYEAFNTFDTKDLTITAVSPWLKERAKLSGIMKRYNVVCVPNGLDTSVFYRRESANLIERNGYKKVILFVTPWFSHSNNDLKGGRYLPVIAQALPDHLFIVVASRMATELNPMPANVQIWGRAKSQDELAQLYSEADMTLLLSHRETFSMVTAESLSCGTPVVGFKAGGPDSIALTAASNFVEYGSIDALVGCIRNYECKTESEEISSKAHGLYGSNAMAHSYAKVYESLCNKCV